MKAYTNDTNGLLNKKLDDYLLSIKPTQQPKAAASSDNISAPKPVNKNTPSPIRSIIDYAPKQYKSMLPVQSQESINKWLPTKGQLSPSSLRFDNIATPKKSTKKAQAPPQAIKR